MQKRLTDLPVQRKLMLLTLLASIFALGLACAGFAIYERSAFRVSTGNELSALADTLRPSCAASLAASDPRTAQETLAALGAEPNVVAARLYDNQGKVFAEYRRRGLAEDFTMPQVATEGTRVEKHSLTLSRTVRQNSVQRGTIVILSDLLNGPRFHEYAKIALGTLALSVLFTFLISSRMLRMVGEQIERSSHMLGEERRVLELIAQGASLKQVLDTLTSAIERISGNAFCSILLLGADGQHLMEGSGGGLPRDYMQAVSRLQIGPSVGACGTAAFHNQTTVVEDIATDYRFEGPREFVLSYGLRACWSVPIRDSKGAVLGTFAMYHGQPSKPRTQDLRLVEAGAYLAGNAIERLRAEESLRENAERFDLAERAASFGIWQFDPNTGKLTISPGCAALIGMSGARQLTIERWREITHPEDRRAMESAITQASRIGDALETEFRVVRPDGSLRWLRNLARVESGENGSRMVGASIDVTAQKEMVISLEQSRTAAEAASRAKSEFLGNMSHEIRTPLNGIIGMTELALDTNLSAEQREYLETVKLSADTLLAVINDILDFSKIEAGKIDLEATDFNLRDVLETTLKTSALRADEKGLELLCDIDPELPELVNGDPNRIRQIVTNLVGNAIKFTPKGEVTLKARLDEERAEGRLLHFTVSDTGIGISADKQQSIFDPFIQADSSTTRKYGGTGLGLTISARLVAMMGGKIWCLSEPERGSQFHFTALLKPAQSKAEPETKAHNQALRGLKVLIVDDNETNRRVLRGMLKAWEVVATDVARADQAIAELVAAQRAGEPYRMVLADMHMPEMNGFTLVEEIRRRPDLCPLPIMMLTSAGYRGDAARCQVLGIRSYLLKPIRKSELLSAMLSLLGQSQLDTGGADRQQPLAGGKTLRILLAEDNRVNQTVAGRMLEKMGHSLLVANNGREALALLDQHSVDLVLMDIQMPELDGVTATKKIRERETGTPAHVPIIAMTAHAMKGDRELCLAGGMDGYLSKPINIAELEQVIAKFANSGTADPVSPVQNSLAPVTPPTWDPAHILAGLGGDQKLLAKSWISFWKKRRNKSRNYATRKNSATYHRWQKSHTRSKENWATWD